ncbi:MAG: MBL fold metallo-hydrolase [Gemmatimonadota bacterium]
MRAQVLVVLLALLAPNQGAGQQPIAVTPLAGSLYRIDGAVDNIVVSVGPDGLLMVDTGYPFAVAGVRARLAELAGKSEPDILLNTHQHHGFANHLYADGSTRLIAHQATAERMERTALMAGVVLTPFPDGARPTETFRDSLTLRFNGERITLFHLPRAHTAGDVAVWFQGSNVLATGDAFVPHQPWISLDAGADVDGLLDGLDRILAAVPDDVIVVPGHDHTATLEDVRGLRDLVAAAVDTVRARMDRGLSLLQTQLLGLPAELAAWEGSGVRQEFFLESIYRSVARARTNPGAPSLAFENGRWFDDGGFTPTTMYAVGGVLTTTRPPRVDRTIDLGGGWVVPPFAEAHTHRLSDARTLDAEHQRFLADGVFYAAVQDAATAVTEAHRSRAEDPALVDVSYTQGVVTPSWGVMPRFYAAMASTGRYGAGVKGPELEGSLYFVVDDPATLDGKWPAIRARNDRFVKVIVAFSDDIERRRDDPEAFGAAPPRYSARPGVTPEVLSRLVELAHRDGLAVSAHIETAADFRVALEAGVDWIAHMPASWQIGEGTGVDDPAAWRLTPQDAFAARRAGVPVVTTLSLGTPDDPRAEAFRTVHAHNLATLAQAGAPLAVGSDLFVGTSVAEALHLATFDALTDAQIFTLLAVQTPRLIFPERRIGFLRDGYEASFVVLGADPLSELSAIRDIRLRVKNGIVLR